MPKLLAVASWVELAKFADRLPGLSRPRHWIEPIGRPEVPTLPEVMRTASSALLTRILMLLAISMRTRTGRG